MVSAIDGVPLYMYVHFNSLHVHHTLLLSVIFTKMVISSLVPRKYSGECSQISWVRTNEVARLVFVLYLSGFGVKCFNVAR